MAKYRETTTAARVRELLHFDPETGVFTRRVRTARRTHVGDIAGCDNGHGYIFFMVDGRAFLAHRLAWLYMTGEWPKADIDHVNCDRADNRFCNLREATRSQNRTNARMRRADTSGFKGVSWSEHAGKYRASIKIRSKSKNLGYFATPQRAFLEYCFAAWRHFGDFARIDAAYLVPLRRLKAERKAFERSVLWNLANPDPNYMIAA